MRANYRTLVSLVFINSSNAALTRARSRHEKSRCGSRSERRGILAGCEISLGYEFIFIEFFFRK